MVEAQGGDVSVFDDLKAFHKPGATQVLKRGKAASWRRWIPPHLGWAVQRLGAGREKAGEPVDPHAGIEFHARRGAHVEKGQPFATLYATNAEMLAEPIELHQARNYILRDPPEAVPLVSRIFTREDAENYLRKKFLSASLKLQ